MKFEGVRLLDWDTEFFGFPVAELHVGHAAGRDLQSALEIAKCRNVSLLVCKSDDPVDWPEGVEAHLVDVAQSLTFDLAAGDRSDFGGASLPITVHDAPELTPDIDRLARLAGTFSRFYADPRFPKHLADRMFETWPRRTLTDPDQFRLHVATADDGRLAGILVSQIQGEAGRPSLLAVDRAFRGREYGLTEGFFLAAWQWFESRGVTEGRVVTQRRNRAAIAAYSALGWKLAGVEHVYHVWLNPVQAESSASKAAAERVPILDTAKA